MLGGAECAEGVEIGADRVAQAGIRPGGADRGAVIAALALVLHPGGAQLERELGIDGADPLDGAAPGAAGARDGDRTIAPAGEPPEADGEIGIEVAALGEPRGELEPAVALEQHDGVLRGADEVGVDERRTLDLAFGLELLGGAAVELSERPVDTVAPRRPATGGREPRGRREVALATRGQPQREPVAPAGLPAEPDRVAQRILEVPALERVGELAQVAPVAAGHEPLERRAQQQPGEPARLGGWAAPAGPGTEIGSTSSRTAAGCTGRLATDRRSGGSATRTTGNGRTGASSGSKLDHRPEHEPRGGRERLELVDRGELQRAVPDLGERPGAPRALIGARRRPRALPPRDHGEAGGAFGAHHQRAGEQEQPAAVGQDPQRGAGAPGGEDAAAGLGLADDRNVEDEAAGVDGAADHSARSSWRRSPVVTSRTSM